MSQIRYSTGAIVLHWAIAIAVIANWRIAEAAHELPRDARGELMGTHMALGMTILFLTLLRLAWRVYRKPPPLYSGLKPLEARAAKAMHAIFYILLLALPMGGWLAKSFTGTGVSVFGLMEVPALPVGQNLEMAEQIFELHETAGSVMLLLVALHVLGALKHHFLDKDGNIYRMLPFGTPKA